MLMNNIVKKTMAALCLMVALILSTACLSFAEDVTEEEKARILTRGYDISEFTVIDDTSEEVVISDLAETVHSVHLMGQARFTGGFGSMMLGFEGNAVGVIIEKGAFTVYIDDEETDVIWASSAGAPQLIYYIENLDNTYHTITLVSDPDLATEKIGENYSVIEGFIVQTVPGNGSATGGDSEFDPGRQDISEAERNKIITNGQDLSDYIIIDDTAIGISQSGMSSTSDNAHINGNAMFTGGDAVVNYTFEGNCVGVIAEKGGFEIFVDGKSEGQFMLQTANAPSVLCFISDLAPGKHTVEVRASASLAKEGTGENWSVFEGFFVQREPEKGEEIAETQTPTDAPTQAPTEAPTEVPSDVPTQTPVQTSVATHREETAAPSVTKESGVNNSSKDTSKTDNVGKSNGVSPLPFVFAGIAAAAVVVIVVLLKKRKKAM